MLVVELVKAVVRKTGFRVFKSRPALKVTTKLKDVPSYSLDELCPYDFSSRCLFRDNIMVYVVG